MTLSQLYIIICRICYTICFTSNHHSENHNRFLTSEGLFTKKYVQRGNEDPKHISSADQHTSQYSFLALGTQALLSTMSGQTHRPGPSASRPRWFLLAGSHPGQQPHQRQHLACTTGTLRGLQSLRGLRPDLQSQEVCGWKGGGKKLSVETEAVGAEPHFPAWPRDRHEEWSPTIDSEPPDSTETRTL